MANPNIVTCPTGEWTLVAAGVLSFDVHLQLNSVGSDEEYVK